jgi:hypothetical protein
MTILAFISLSKRVLPYRILRERDPEGVLPNRMLPYRVLRDRNR